MAVISVSRRTDIPAFYSEWFFNRIKQGYAIYFTAFSTKNAFVVPLDKESVDCFVFWTKNAEPMLNRLDELDGYTYYFQYTVNPYGQDVEKNVPSWEIAADTFIALSKKIGKEKVIWRYDPIFFTDKYSFDWHIQMFEKLSHKLSGYTEKCVISFVDLDSKPISRNTNPLGIRAPSEIEMKKIAQRFSEVAKKYGFVMASCAEAIDLGEFNIEHNSCIDGALIDRLSGIKHKYPLDKQRPMCNCVQCSDIGAYNTCKHNCVYCYANPNKYDVSRFVIDNDKEWLDSKISGYESIYFNHRKIKNFELWRIDHNSEDAYFPLTNKNKPQKNSNTVPNVKINNTDEKKAKTLDEFF